MIKRIVLILLIALLVVAVALPATGQGAKPSDVVLGPFPLDRPTWTPPDFVTAQSQVFPEGCLGHGFETWLVFYNSTDNPAKIIIIASGESCYFKTGPFEVKPHQRLTYDMAKVFISYPNPQFTWSPDVSFRVLSTLKGVYAQESMYWNNREGGSTSTGIIEGER